MNNLIVDRTYFLEIPSAISTAVKQNIPFPKIEYLDGMYIQGISFYRQGSMPVTPQNIPVVNDSLLLSSFLTLYEGTDQRIWNIPVIDLVTNGAAVGGIGNEFALEFNNIKVDLSKSYIFVANTATFAGTMENYAMNIKYTKTPITQNN